METAITFFNQEYKQLLCKGGRSLISQCCCFLPIRVSFTKGENFLILIYLTKYFPGSSVPSVFVLWVMRELPPPLVTYRQQESRTIAFISDSSVTVQPQRWTAAASAQNQVTCLLLSLLYTLFLDWFRVMWMIILTSEHFENVYCFMKTITDHMMCKKLKR